jgi:hypothetical protein
MFATLIAVAVFLATLLFGAEILKRNRKVELKNRVHSVMNGRSFDRVAYTFVNGR